MGAEQHWEGSAKKMQLLLPRSNNRASSPCPPIPGSHGHGQVGWQGQGHHSSQAAPHWLICSVPRADHPPRRSREKRMDLSWSGGKKGPAMQGHEQEFMQRCKLFKCWGLVCVLKGYISPGNLLKICLDLHFFSMKINHHVNTEYPSSQIFSFFLQKVLNNLSQWHLCFWVTQARPLNKPDAWVSTGSRVPKYAEDPSAMCEFYNYTGLAIQDMHDIDVRKSHFIKFHRWGICGAWNCFGKSSKIKTSLVVGRKQERLWIMLSWRTSNCSNWLNLHEHQTGLQQEKSIVTATRLKRRADWVDVDTGYASFWGIWGQLSQGFSIPHGTHKNPPQVWPNVILFSQASFSGKKQGPGEKKKEKAAFLSFFWSLLFLLG